MPQRTCGASGCAKPVRARGLCSTHYNQQHQPDRHRKSTVKCGQCGKATLKHVAQRYGARFCNLACRDAWRAEQARQRKLPVPYVGEVTRPVPVRPEPARSTRRWVAGNCHRCGKAYVVEDYTDRARYCSHSCYRSDAKARRRARKRSAEHVPYSRVQVFERDGYRCHLCKRMTQRTAAVPHPRAPVIDHLIPLGPGADAMHNVATACFLCNSKRRDIGPAQLILFG